MKKCHSQVFDCKRPLKALSTEMVQKATDFFNHGNVSRTDPSFASVSLKTQEPKWVMEITLKAAHQVFEEEAKHHNFFLTVCQTAAENDKDCQTNEDKYLLLQILC